MRRPLLGAIGVLTALVPERLAGAFEGLAVEDPASVAWNERLTDGVRAIGVVYVPLALWERRQRNGT
ncbi:hypothetical protein C464_04046 [Halorubrum coriense DSM 10284]|uniref:Uncharacterized protein n=1 Tax=Halorubrum coriense DSM 10284 TaxID=1227466 RepID=M0ERU6_9EURY|nr:hypothetical protein [Halorubrum coriense]ELZ49617.1 hypothetical protein C464_04046 [Halorubrum coriense DSM 10284]